MSQPPKSTMRAPRVRWASLRMVLRVMAGSGGWGGRRNHYLLPDLKAPLIRRFAPPSPRKRGEGKSRSAPHPALRATFSPLAGRRELGGLDLQLHAVGAGDADAGAGGEVGAGDGPVGVGDLHAAATGDDRVVQRHHLADQRRGPAVELGPVALRFAPAEPAAVYLDGQEAEHDEGAD